MYNFVTDTWNPIKGECEHGCSYCYMKKNKQKPLYLDEQDLETDLDIRKFIFVGSSTDMFAPSVPREWIKKVLEKCRQYANKYLFQTKNPARLLTFINNFPLATTFCTTIESNRFYFEYMGKTPDPKHRARVMEEINSRGIKTMVTVEPIMDFDLGTFVKMLKAMHPQQINIGADSTRCGLPHPPKVKTLALITELEKFTKVHIKDNLYKIYD